MRMHAHAEKIQPSAPVMELSVKQKLEKNIFLYWRNLGEIVNSFGSHLFWLSTNFEQRSNSQPWFNSSSWLGSKQTALNQRGVYFICNLSTEKKNRSCYSLICVWLYNSFYVGEQYLLEWKVLLFLFCYNLKEKLHSRKAVLFSSVRIMKEKTQNCSCFLLESCTVL